MTNDLNNEGLKALAPEVAKLEKQIAEITTAKEAAKKQADAAVLDVGKAFLQASKDSLDYVAKHLDPKDAAEAVNTKRLLDISESSADKAKYLFSDDRNSYYRNLNPNPNMVNEFNQAKAISAQTEGFSSIIKGNTDSSEAAEGAKTLGPVDTADTNRSDPNSYLYKYDSVSGKYRSAISNYRDATNNIDPNSEIGKIATRRLNECEKQYAEIQKTYNDGVIESAAKNAKALYAEAQNPDAQESPRILYQRVSAQLDLLTRSLNAIQAKEPQKYDSVNKEFAAMITDVGTQMQRFRLMRAYAL